MKRRVLLRTLAKIAESKNLTLEFVRHGANHDIYRIGDRAFPVGRHGDIPEQTALGTIREARNV